MMSTVSNRFCRFLVAAGLAKASAVSATDFYGQRLESLKKFEAVDTRVMRGRPSVWIFFQPACASCRAQLRDLRCLPRDLNKVAVGVFASAENLRSTLIGVPTLDFHFKASPNFENETSVKATPTIYLVDSDGRPRHRLVGRIPCEQLMQMLD